MLDAHRECCAECRCTVTTEDDCLRAVVRQDGRSRHTVMQSDKRECRRGDNRDCILQRQPASLTSFSMLSGSGCCVGFGTGYSECQQKAAAHHPGEAGLGGQRPRDSPCPKLPACCPKQLHEMPAVCDHSVLQGHNPHELPGVLLHLGNVKGETKRSFTTSGLCDKGLSKDGCILQR